MMQEDTEEAILKLNYITHQERSLKSLTLLPGVPAKEADVTLPHLASDGCHL